MEAHGFRTSGVRSPGGITFTGAAAVAAVALAWFALPQEQIKPSVDWMLLAVLALIAEMLPAEVGTRGRLRFTLPFVVAVCVLFGPTAAWLTDVAVILAANVAGGTLSGHSIRPRELIHLASWTSVAATVGGFAFSMTAARVIDGDLRWMAATAAYVAGYAAIHPLLASRLSTSLRIREESSLASPGGLAMTLYFCLSLAGAVFVVNGATLLAPLMLGPILAIRSLLAARSRLAEANRHTVATLAMMLRRAHPYTHRHLERVADISEQVASYLGLSPERSRVVREAAVLHDIGKIAIDESILDLPRRLTDEEYEHVKLHAVYGAEILAEVDGLREVSHWIRHHHERPDGMGYPSGLLDPEIPIESKIIAAVDAFDAMTGGMEGSDGRPFRPAISTLDALDELDRCSGTQFDPAVVRAFREVIGGRL